jgi:hypothetical protein
MKHDHSGKPLCLQWVVMGGATPDTPPDRKPEQDQQKEPNGYLRPDIGSRGESAKPSESKTTGEQAQIEKRK